MNTGKHKHYSILRNRTHWNTLQHTATRCNTLQHTATHCKTKHYSILIPLGCVFQYLKDVESVAYLFLHSIWVFTYKDESNEDVSDESLRWVVVMTYWIHLPDLMSHYRDESNESLRRESNESLETCFEWVVTTSRRNDSLDTYTYTYINMYRYIYVYIYIYIYMYKSIFLIWWVIRKMYQIRHYDALS